MICRMYDGYIYILYFLFLGVQLLSRRSWYRTYGNELSSRAVDWLGYPTYYSKTQSLGGSFTMHDPNLWAQLNYASTQTQWVWEHYNIVRQIWVVV